MAFQQQEPNEQIATHPVPDQITSVQNGAVGARPRSASVITHRDFDAPAEVVWDALMFYEEIEECPPFFWRLFLPVPIGTEGCKFEVGGEVKCRYEGGHLLKRVTQIIRTRIYAFDVIEQNIALSGGIRLLGGDYTLRELSEGQTRVALATRYASSYFPRWLYGRLEATVCHSFHRHILTAMQGNLCPGSTKRRKQ